MQKTSRQLLFHIAFCFLAAVLYLVLPAYAAEMDSENSALSDHFRTDSPQDQRGQNMRILWTVSSYHRTPNATWGDAEARKLLSAPLDITISSISFNNKSCTGITFSSSVTETAGYFHERFQISPSLINYHEQEIQVIRTHCDIPEFKEYVRLGDRRLLLFSHGVLFVLSPAVTY